MVTRRIPPGVPPALPQTAAAVSLLSHLPPRGPLGQRPLSSDRTPPVCPPDLLDLSSSGQIAAVSPTFYGSRSPPPLLSRILPFSALVALWYLSCWRATYSRMLSRFTVTSWSSVTAILRRILPFGNHIYEVMRAVDIIVHMFWLCQAMGGLRLYPRAAAALLRTILRKAQNQWRLRFGSRLAQLPTQVSGSRAIGRGTWINRLHGRSGQLDSGVRRNDGVGFRSKCVGGVRCFWQEPGSVPRRYYRTCVLVMSRGARAEPVSN